MPMLFLGDAGMSHLFLASSSFHAKCTPASPTHSAEESGIPSGTTIRNGKRKQSLHVAEVNGLKK